MNEHPEEKKVTRWNQAKKIANLIKIWKQTENKALVFN